MKIRMSPDHLCEEGLANREGIDIPFNIILSFSILLTISYRIHLNEHFDLYGLIARIFFGYITCGPGYITRCFTGIFFYISIITSSKRKQHWTLPIVETIKQNKILPEIFAPDTGVILTARPQITFL